MVDDWVVGEYMELTKNPDYWEMGEDGQPLPYLDEVRLTQVPEDSTRVLQVQSGETDAHGRHRVSARWRSCRTMQSGL